MNVSEKRFTIARRLTIDRHELQVLKLENVSEISYTATEGGLTQNIIIIKMDDGRQIDTEIPHDSGVEFYDIVRDDFITRIGE